MTCGLISLLGQEISAKGKSSKKTRVRKEVLDDMGTAYEEVKKDLNALSREEQMDVLYRWGFSFSVPIVRIIMTFDMIFVSKVYVLMTRSFFINDLPIHSDHTNVCFLLKTFVSIFYKLQQFNIFSFCVLG